MTNSVSTAFPGFNRIEFKQKRLGLGLNAIPTLCCVHKLTGHHCRDDRADKVLEVPPQTLSQGRQLILVQIHSCWVCGKKREEKEQRMRERKRDELMSCPIGAYAMIQFRPRPSTH